MFQAELDPMLLLIQTLTDSLRQTVIYFYSFPSTMQSFHLWYLSRLGWIGAACL